MTLYFTLLALGISAVALFFSWRADRRQKKSQEREEKSAVLQIKPYIQARPVSFFVQSGFGHTILEVTNPSGYEASELSLDIKYEENDWIAEWLKANNQPVRGVLKLPPGEGLTSFFAGRLPYPEEEFFQRRKKFKVLVRSRWKNELGRSFETIRQYQLQSTTVGDSHSFTFILQEQKSYE